jgi:hypothetical protein
MKYKRECLRHGDVPKLLKLPAKLEVLIPQDGSWHFIEGAGAKWWIDGVYQDV